MSVDEYLNNVENDSLSLSDVSCTTSLSVPASNRSSRELSRSEDPESIGRPTRQNASHRRKSRNVRWTINNYTEEDLARLDRVLEEVEAGLHRSVTYIVFGREIAPTTGTPHLQGYTEVKNSTTWNTFRTILGPRAAFKSCEASGPANADYCKKDGDYREAGTLRPGQGVRTDLKMVADSVKQGKKLKEVSQMYPEQFIKFHQGIGKLIGLQEPSRTAKPWVLWLWGPPGTGKSRSAFELGQRAGSYYYKDLTLWWDHYEQQQVCIFDDFRPAGVPGSESNITFTYLLRVLDCYPMQVQKKGSYAQFNSPIIILTSPQTPKDTFAHVTENLHQLTRRIDHVVHFPALIEGATADDLLANMPDVPAPIASSFIPPPPPNVHGSESDKENVPPPPDYDWLCDSD